MNSKEIVYNRFIKPFENKNMGEVGVELEFPLVNNNGGDVDVPFLLSMMNSFCSENFKCVIHGNNNEKLFIENEFGDCLSFDNSYNNFEFSMMHNDNLLIIYSRFTDLFNKVTSFLAKGNHSLVGRGTNPNAKNIKVNHVPFSTYDMIHDFLHFGNGSHNYPDFPAFMSSIQTHLDLNINDLPLAYNVFNRLDFVRGILFHNSPDFEGKGYRIFRDYLWEESAFKSVPNITGPIDKHFSDINDITDFFMQKGLFNRIRNEKYEIFEPIKIKDYFTNCDNNALKEDIECYLSFCNVELTCRGTLEVRGDCTQPFNKSFSPAAFNLGILYQLNECKQKIDKFMKENNINLSNSKLREIVTTGKDLSLIAPLDKLQIFIDEIKELALKGLIIRNKGEEKLLLLA